VFSRPLKLDSIEDDYYRVYPAWCRELESDLARVCTAQLGLPRAQVDRIVAYGRDYCYASIFLNPGKLRSRLQSYRRLEHLYPGLSVARAVRINPVLLTHTAATLARKLARVRELMPAQSAATTGAAISRCPSLLTRSPASLAAVRACLEQHLGEAAADAVAVQYPEVYSRSVATLEGGVRGALAFCDGDTAAAHKMLLLNTALITRSDLSTKVECVARAAHISAEKVFKGLRWRGQGLGCRSRGERAARVSAADDAADARVPQAHALVRSTPTVLNLSEDTLNAKCTALRAGLAHWATSLNGLTPSTIARCLTCSLPVIARLQHLAALGRTGELSPTQALKLPAAKFSERFGSLALAAGDG